jgi:hypothetical protein
MEPDARANQLYWESDRSVNQIAEELDLSKGMLYGMIRPLTAHLSCPRCTSSMEFGNRTARERGLLTCPSCGLQADEATARQSLVEPPVGTISGHDTRAPVPGTTPTPQRRHDPVVLGAGLLLLATGLWLFRGLGRR